MTRILLATYKVFRFYRGRWHLTGLVTAKDAATAARLQSYGYDEEPMLFRALALTDMPPHPLGRPKGV